MEILKIISCLYVSNFNNFNTKHYFINTMLCFFLCFLFPVFAFWMTFFRNLLAVFFFIVSNQSIDLRRQSLNLCMCCYFCPTFALNLSERNYLLTGKSGSLRLFFNDALCNITAIFHLIDKSFFYMPLKLLVLTTH